MQSIEFKRRQQEVLISQRAERSGSILDGLPIVAMEPAKEAQEGDPLQGAVPPKCGYCKGEGKVAGMFGKNYECHLCSGTGYDLSDPVAIIQYLQAEGRKLKGQCKAIINHHKKFRSMWSCEEVANRIEAERRRAEMEHFAKHSSRFD